MEWCLGAAHQTTTLAWVGKWRRQVATSAQEQRDGSRLWQHSGEGRCRQGLGQTGCQGRHNRFVSILWRLRHQPGVSNVVSNFKRMMCCRQRRQKPFVSGDTHGQHFSQ